jgi:hypothetical protein
MRRPRTPVTKLLIVANVLAFVYEVGRVGPALLMGGGSLQRLVEPVRWCLYLSEKMASIGDS